MLFRSSASARYHNTSALNAEALFDLFPAFSRAWSKSATAPSKSPEFNFSIPSFLSCVFPGPANLSTSFPTPNTRRTTKRIQQSPIRTFFRRLFLLRLLRVLDLLLPLEYLPLPALLLLLFTGLFPILLTSFTVCTAKTAVSLFAAVIIFCNSKWEENSLGKSCTF